MKKKVFMDELKEALAGRVPTEVYYDTVQYYEEYFRRQMAEGKSEEQIAASLGSARLVAKTIIETSGRAGDNQFYDIPEDRKKRTDRNTGDRKSYQKGWHIHVDDEGKTSLAFGRLNFGTVLGKILSAFVLLVVIAVVIFLVLVGLNILFYVAVPVALILFVVYLITSAIDKK